MKEKYNPISCSFYDELLLLADHKKLTTLTWQMPGESAMTITGKIKDIYTRSGVEYLLLDDEQEIRLDFIITAKETVD